KLGSSVPMGFNCHKRIPCVEKQIHRIYERRKMYPFFHGELKTDQILREYFPDYTYQGVFFDIGAYEPKNISNSYHFEKNGWDTYCFEANTLLIDDLKEERQHVYNVAIADTNQDNVTFNVVKSKPGSGGGGHRMASFSALQISDRYLNRFVHSRS